MPPNRDELIKQLALDEAMQGADTHRIIFPSSSAAYKLRIRHLDTDSLGLIAPRDHIASVIAQRGHHAALQLRVEQPLAADTAIIDSNMRKQGRQHHHAPPHQILASFNDHMRRAL
jgi:hypothetical protein